MRRRFQFRIWWLIRSVFEIAILLSSWPADVHCANLPRVECEVFHSRSIAEEELFICICCYFADLLIWKMFTFCLGPTLLFERFVKGKKLSKRYYACSATRDRKLCSFYCLVDDKHFGQKSKIDIKEDDRTSFPYSHNECIKRWATFQAGNLFFPVVFSFLKTLLWKWAIFMGHDCVKLCNDFWISLLYAVSVVD